MGKWFWLVNLVKGKGKMITNKKISERLDLIEENLIKKIEKLETNNNTRFKELEEKTKLNEEICKLKVSVKDKEAINQELSTDLKKVNDDNASLKNCKEELNNSIEFKDSQLFEAEENAIKLNGIINDLQEHIKVLNGRIGGLTKYNNRLCVENKYLKQQLKGNKSDPKIQVLPPDKTKYIQKTRVKNKVKNYQAKEILKSKTNDDNLN